MKFRNEYLLLGIPFCAALLFWGSMYSYGVLFTGVILAILFIIRTKQTGKCILYKNKIIYGSFLLAVPALISVWTGIDKGMSFYGFLRVAVLLGWLLFLMQFSDADRFFLLRMLPFIACLMILACLILVCFPSGRNLVWQAQRLGGVFQYANTCALFFLLALRVLAEEEISVWISHIMTVVLIFGVFLTGSRGGLLLLIVLVFYICIKKKSFRKSVLLSFVFFLTVGAGYTLFLDNYQNLGRIFTLFSRTSTLTGRLLYIKDAMSLILKHPLGLGYFGYSEIQPFVQTGVYTTTFVHNDWMQMFLDYGWIFAILVVLLTIWQLVRGKQGSLKKQLLLLICIYSIVDFHLQYFFIQMLVVLLCDFSQNPCSVRKRSALWETTILAAGCAVLFCYFGIANISTVNGAYSQARNLYPGDTQAIEGQMAEETNREAAVLLAKQRLHKNTYSAQAWNILAYAALQDGDYEQALANKLQVLSIARYQMAEYEDFETMLNEAAIYAADNGDTELFALCEDAYDTALQLLDETRAQTSPIAYKLRDKPVFEW